MMSQADYKNVHIAFVDPFSSGKYLATVLRATGITISAIYTTNELQNNYLSFQSELFDHTFFLENLSELPDLIAKLRTFNVNRIYYGSESSVSIADQLAHAVSPKIANAIDTSAARCDKYEMQEMLRKVGIPCVKQIKIQKQLNAEQKKELASWTFPVIVKPSNNFGSLGVQVCASINEIELYLQAQFNVNGYGQAIEFFVLQEFLQGDEYFVDTFSHQGEHIVSGAQAYKRILFEQRPLCLYSEVVSPDSKEAVACIQYVKQTLSAVGLNNGLAHTEVMLTKNGPYLIEVNPRISGASGFNNKLFAACGYPTQIDLLIASCQASAMPQIKDTCYGRKVYLYNFKEQAIGELNLALLQELASFQEGIMIKAPGTMVPVPKSLADTVAFVLLAHTDPNQVERDFNQILAWEKNLALF